MSCVLGKQRYDVGKEAEPILQFISYGIYQHTMPIVTCVQCCSLLSEHVLYVSMYISTGQSCA